MTMRPWMPFSRSVSENLSRTGYSVRDEMACKSHPRQGVKAFPLVPSPCATESLAILQNGLHKLVVSLDLLQKDHIEWGGVQSQQFSGPLIVNHFRDLLFHISGQLKDLTRQEL